MATVYQLHRQHGVTSTRTLASLQGSFVAKAMG
jgi:hypothetical protein